MSNEIMGRPTVADYNSWRFNREAVHYNGGSEFFGYGHRCIDQPRLLVIDKYFKRDHSTQRSFQVDGQTSCTTLDEALDALTVPPTVNAEERALMATLGDDWHVPEKRAPYLPLADKGFVTWGRDADDRVTLRITDAGRAALKSPAPEASKQREEGK